MAMRVECAPGWHGEPEPQVVWFGERRVAVQAIEDRWFAPARRWFRVHGDDGQRYVLRLDESSGAWDLAALTRETDAG